MSFGNRLLASLGLHPDGYNSVWTVPGPFDEEAEEQNFSEIGYKVIGPVSPQVAYAESDMIVSKFKSRGIDVVQHTFADD